MGRNTADFNGINFQHISDDSGGGMIIAHLHDGQEIGEIHLDAPDEQGRHAIGYVGVGREWRNKGVASRLYEHAKALGYNPHHSSNMTSQGLGFANKVGGPWMDSNLEKAYAWMRKKAR